MLFTQHFYHCQEENYKSLSDHSSYVPQIVVHFPEPQLTARCWIVRPELDIETRPVSFRALPFIFKLRRCAGGQVYAQVLPPSPKLPASLSKMISCVSSEWFMISLREPSIHPLPCLILPTSESTHAVVVCQEYLKAGWDQQYMLS